MIIEFVAHRLIKCIGKNCKVAIFPFLNMGTRDMGIEAAAGVSNILLTNTTQMDAKPLQLGLF